MGELDRLGWSHYDTAAGADLVPGTVLGRVRRVDRGEVDVATAAGDVRAVSDSVRAQSSTAPVTGDWVALVDDADVGLRVDSVHPRLTAIVRRDPSEKEIEQVLVANVDVVGVVAAVDRPANIARIERFLVLAQDSGADPVVVLTKSDLGLTDEWAEVRRQLGDVTVLVTSAVDGGGVGELKALIAADRSLVLLGESGSGKSTLVNAILDDDVQETGAVREGDAKGRHTTTARELLVVPTGGVLIDTPGIRGVGLWDAEHAVEQVFADIAEIAADCRFGDCSHRVEPDCAVQASAASAEEGSLDPRRLARYLRLRDELDEHAARIEEQRRKPEGRRRRRRR